ncbi:MAG TPA: DEAD/DEAH box helicase, partial [Acidimicrobiia bacterium]
MTLASFWASLPFDPDPFQIQAAEAVEAGRTVVVAAPTGSGKTVVAEAAVHLALERGKRAFYTTPLKALSNQKYVDFSKVYGQSGVGLLTGDNVINGGAPVVVMTTEVLRNMIYAGSRDLDDLEVAVLDEVHYLQDPSRGAVWEEVIIHAPRAVQLVALSATVSNAEAFARWIEDRRGPTLLVEERQRPVPLDSLFLLKDTHAPDGLMMFPLFAKQRRDPNPELTRLLTRRGRGRPRFRTPRRAETIRFLEQRGMLPAIYFIFSRAGCEAAAHQVLQEGLSFTTRDDRKAIR